MSKVQFLTVTHFEIVKQGSSKNCAKGTAEVISSDPPFMKLNVQFTPVPLTCTNEI